MSEKEVNETMHDLILDELKTLNTNVEDLKTKIFVGNGREALTTTIQRNTTICKALVFCVGILYIALTTAFINSQVDKNKVVNKEKVEHLYHSNVNTNR